MGAVVLEKLIAEGGFGRVYAARADGRRVAVKVARAGDPRAAERLLRERDALRAVGPPTAPLLLAEAEVDGACCLIMELMTAPTLADRLAGAPGGLPAAELARWGRSVARALAAVHAAGVAHRDLKPANVFLCEPGVRLVDFGLVGAREGTPAYMAPEQCAGDALAGQPADIYSLGVILFEMATGRLPFTGSPAELRHAHLSSRPPPPSRLADVPAAFDQVVARCLAKDPSARFASAGELEQALATGLAGPPPAAAARSAVATGLHVASPARSALLVAEPAAGPAVLAPAVSALGGRLAHVGPRHVVAAFTGGGRLAPVAAAERAGHALAQGGLIRRAIVDVAVLATVQTADGRERIVGPLGARGERLLAGVAPGEVARTRAAADALPAAGEALPCVGRDELLAALVASARRAAHGEPTIISVLAEPGHGKTRLAAALAGELRAAGLDVVSLAARELAPGPRPPSLLAAAGLAEAQAQLDGGADRLAAMRAAGATLRARAATCPLCVVLDDAQFADSTTLDALEYAAVVDATAEAGCPIWICLLARPTFARARPSLGERAAQHQVVELGPLDRAAARDLCLALLAPADRFPAAAVDRLVARTGGVPLALVELVNGLKRAGLIQRNERGDAWLATDALDSLPDLPVVEWLVERELASLPPALAAHARLAALLAPEVTAGELDGVIRELSTAGEDRFSLDARAGLDRLSETGMIERRNGHYAFRHALWRDAVAETAGPELRRIVDLAAARFYWMPAGLPDDERLRRFAFHAARAGRSQEAARLYLGFAEEAARRHAYLDAEPLFGRALQTLPDGARAERLDALRGRGRLRCRLGRFRESLDDLEQAATVAAELGDDAAQAGLLLDQATTLDWMREYARSQELVDRAAALAGADPGPLLCARLALARGRSDVRFDRTAQATALLEEASRRAESLGQEPEASELDDGYETWVIAQLLLGWVLPFAGRTDEATERLGRVIDECAARGDSVHMASALNNRCAVWLARRDPEAMLRDLEEFIRLAREAGTGDEVRGELHVARVLWYLGRTAEALRRVERVIALERRRFGAVKPFGLLLQAGILVLDGRLDEARPVLDALAERGELLLPADRLTLRALELFSAAAEDGAWDELIARAAAEARDQTLLLHIYELRAHCDLRRGRSARAREWLDLALRLATATPTLIEPRLRRAQSSAANN